ncbi:MAG: response regulator [Candidatus Sericytochromatia bacterium]|nr:response regulator [Candidatus Sericytochromatia bacterium]
MNKEVNILVVEDSATQAEQLKYLLESYSYKVETSINGLDAIEKINKNRPDLIISDIMMPKMNGLSLCETLKSNSSLKFIPFILLTSLSDPEDLLRGLESGADNFIIKPYEPNSLINRIRNLIKNFDPTEEKFKMSMEINFNENSYNINSDRRQILDLMMSTFENAVNQNKELTKSQMELSLLNEQLEERVELRTSKLIEEIYERKKVEDELRNYQNKLESMVENRTLELLKSNEMLKQEIEDRIKIESDLAKRTEDLARVNDELKQFAYIASHDLQEPLRMVSSYTRLLAKRYKDKLDDDANDYINFAVDGAVRMQKLIDSLLYYSRVGTLLKKLKTIALNEIVENVKFNLQLLIEETHATITSDALPELKSDSTQMTQLFQNLMSNSLKYVKEGVEPIINISVKKRNSDWLFSITDNGIGIDKDDYERVFIVFQRLHSKNEYSGTGMGLAICKKIIEYHNGQIWLESEIGKGSTFYFTLPQHTQQISNEN